MPFFAWGHRPIPVLLASPPVGASGGKVQVDLGASRRAREAVLRRRVVTGPPWRYLTHRQCQVLTTSQVVSFAMPSIHFLPDQVLNAG